MDANMQQSFMIVCVTLSLCDSAAGGEIFDHCDCDELLPEGQITRLIRQTLEGVHLLHQTSVVHLDLKVYPSTPLNIYTHTQYISRSALCTYKHMYIHLSTLFALLFIFTSPLAYLCCKHNLMQEGL